MLGRIWSVSTVGGEEEGFYCAIRNAELVGVFTIGTLKRRHILYMEEEDEGSRSNWLACIESKI